PRRPRDRRLCDRRGRASGRRDRSGACHRRDHLRSDRYGRYQPADCHPARQNLRRRRSAHRRLAWRRFKARLYSHKNGDYKMRLEPLCEMHLSYRKEDAYGAEFIELHPYGGEEGSAYGEGDATLTGERLSGTARWANHPHILGDGMVQPNVHGIITTHDGAL